MTEKHHPASSKTARTRTTRAMRRQDRIDVREKHRQKLGTPSVGFVRGARVKALAKNKP